jgi:8-amino-7-oxononanoate synthase
MGFAAQAAIHTRRRAMTQTTPMTEPRKRIATFEDSIEHRQFACRIAQVGTDNPYFVCHDMPLRDTSLVDGRRVINFGSYNYLGMSGHPEVSAAAKAAIDRYGTSASGSRVLAGEKKIYQELEREIAGWKNTEDSLVLAAGNLTNTTCIGNFCNANDAIFYDVLSHNSIDQGCRLSAAFTKRFPHNDFGALERTLRRTRDQYEKVLIVVEGVYSMDGDIAPIPQFVALKRKYGCFLLVDEAHSAGVLGKTGGGVDEHFGLDSDDIDLKVGTLSKATGSIGGYIAGTANLVSYLRYNLPGFLFAAGISPPSAAAALAAIRLLRHDPSILARLHDNIAFFVAEARRRNFNICGAGQSAIVPIMIGRDQDAFAISKRMLSKGVFVPTAAYPAVPKNKARLRFSVISEHGHDQIVQVLDCLSETIQESNWDLSETTLGSA